MADLLVCDTAATRPTNIGIAFGMFAIPTWLDSSAFTSR